MKPEISKPTDQQVAEAQTWPIWEKEASVFPWQYGQSETCLILQGQVTVTNEDGEQFDFGAGDYVTFPQGMKCTWQINQDVKKHYKFG